MSRKPLPNPRSFSVGTTAYADAVASRTLARPNLVDTFFAALAAEGVGVAHAPDWLNRQKGMLATVSYSRMREWASGKRATPTYAARIMARKAIPWALERVCMAPPYLPVEVMQCLAFIAFPWLENDLTVNGVKTMRCSSDHHWLAQAIAPARSDFEARPRTALKSKRSRSK